MFTQPYINFFKNKIIESMDLTGTPVEIRIRNRKGESE
jgi:predicted GTPase